MRLMRVIRAQLGHRGEPPFYFGGDQLRETMIFVKRAGFASHDARTSGAFCNFTTELIAESTGNRCCSSIMMTSRKSPGSAFVAPKMSSSFWTKSLVS